MRHKKKGGKKLHFVLPMLVALLSLSTGTVLASDNCQVSVIQALTNASNAANRHIEPKHKHTKAVLASWEEWGKAYLAKHGHPYVPPKRTYAPWRMLRPQKPNGTFKFECVPPVLETEDAEVDALLTDFEPIEPLDAFLLPLPNPDLITSNGPGSPGPGPGDSGEYPPSYPPVFFGGGSSAPSGPSAPGSPTSPPTPPVTPPPDNPPPVLPPDNPVPPPSPTPEPSSFVLLATGAFAAWGLRRRAQSARTSR